MSAVAVKKPRVPRKKADPAPLKLDLGCGHRCNEGFEGVDLKKVEGVKHVVDLFQAPWPFKTSSVGEIVSMHFVEHIPHYRPEYNGMDGWWIFFNEVHRICRPDAKLTFLHPYAKHDRAFWDPTHTRYINQQTWYYLDANWREAQGLGHYDAACDFEVTLISGMGVPDSITTRTAEYQDHAREHWFNIIPDLQVELKARK